MNEDKMSETFAKQASVMRTVSIVSAAYLIMVLTDGSTLSFGIFLTDFADALEVGLGVVGAASSLATAVAHIFSPFGAFMASKIGYRKTVMIGTLLIGCGFLASSQVKEAWQLFITHSIITGFGVALVYTNTIAFVGLTCDRHISIANGVTLSGTALGWIMLPLLVNTLKAAYGWRGSLQLLGAIVFHATVISQIVFKTESKIVTPSEEKTENYKFLKDCDNGDANEDINKEKTVTEILREYMRLPITYPLFLILIIVSNLIVIAFYGTLYHLVSSAIKKGIPEKKATLLMIIYGIGSMIARLLNGIPIKLKWIKTRNLFVVALIIAGVSSFVLPFCKSYLSVVLVILFIGLASGTCMPLTYLSAREIVGIDNFPKALGMMLFTTAFAVIIGGFFTGWIYDTTGSYNVAFFIMSALFFISCFFLVLPNIWFRCMQEKKNEK
ncbi:monocarboxylate transporter 12-like [Antedon mediterranea]|uniref:monocarboxylate transporter 12-like n=1 Tax=Antedon mediterranea TaxID=105859 RepID=UPI003AF6C468